jgi:hypothetical protein
LAGLWFKKAFEIEEIRTFAYNKCRNGNLNKETAPCCEHGTASTASWIPPRRAQSANPPQGLNLDGGFSHVTQLSPNPSSELPNAEEKRQH